MSIKRNILILFLIANSFIAFSQDSTKKIVGQPNPKTDTTYKPTKFILSDLKYSYINQVNPDTVTRKRFLWYPMKNLEDIFNYLPGYYLKYMDVGQLNPVSYNQLDQYNTGVLRNGRPINDLIDGSIDFNLFSRNEIAEIEISNGFSNNLYNYSNSVNVIQRQIFQNRPYTEISFLQDRYENIYFDGNFHANILRSINFNFGITKQSYDGKYVNSDFDKWIGRFNLNFAASNKLNFFGYVNYAKIQKGLNEGVNADIVDISNKDIIFDPDLAIVRNSDSYEKKERFDIDAGAVLLSGKNSFTKLQLFVSNSFREYRDEENRLNPNGIFTQINEHWITYGGKLQQVFNFEIGRNAQLISRSVAEYDIDILQANDNNISRTYILEDISLKYKSFVVNGYLKASDQKFYKQNFFLNFGASAQYSYRFDSVTSVIIKGGYSKSKELPPYSVWLNRVIYYPRINVYNTGLTFASKNFTSSINFYYNILDYNDHSDFYNHKKYQSGFNADILAKVFMLEFQANYSQVLKFGEPIPSVLEEVRLVPRYSGTAALSFHDAAFKNKLEYKIGLISRAWSEYASESYSGRYNSILWDGSIIPSNGTLDFYIMGKIGRATFGITLENILDRVIYNTGVYPNIDRGGLANVVSRFYLTWNFFD